MPSGATFRSCRSAPTRASARAGDIVVYDGRSLHGVGDIDPLEPLDLAHFSGRAVAMATMFRLLAPGADDYAAMAHTAGDRYGGGTR
jgi:hypothetical protein